MQVNLDWKGGFTFSKTTASGYSLIARNDVDEAANK